MAEVKGIQKIDIEKLIPYINNAKKHDDSQVTKIASSIREFGFVNPVLIDKDYNIIAGHGRVLAAKKLGLATVPALYVEGLTDTQRKAYILADNRLGELAEWDMELVGLELAELDDVGFDIDLTGFEIGALDSEGGSGSDNAYDQYPDGEKGSLAERYGVPPFSVLDCRKGDWISRKQEWLKLTGNLSETRDGDYGIITNSKNTIITAINGGTSNFDPVLAEIMFKWFCPAGGAILDPFGGEQTKGVVAGHMGYKYTACEFREEQVNVNNEATARYDGVKYYCGDSNNIDTIIPERDFDMCFTSPPYYDLEVYSAEDSSALPTYEEFMLQYKNIFGRCYNMMKDTSFLVVKVGEIRDKDGIYRNFVGDNVRVMAEIGFKYYNEIILVQSCGTAPLRAEKSMRNRKVTKVHQNVLVFLKGNPKDIAKRFPALKFDDIEESAEAYQSDAGEVEEYT